MAVVVVGHGFRRVVLLFRTLFLPLIGIIVLCTTIPTSLRTTASTTTTTTTSSSATAAGSTTTATTSSATSASPSSTRASSSSSRGTASVIIAAHNTGNETSPISEQLVSECPTGTVLVSWSTTDTTAFQSEKPAVNPPARWFSSRLQFSKFDLFACQREENKKLRSRSNIASERMTD